DRYGILPLFVGSLLVSLVALAIAVPFGVGAAIYVNQIATVREQKLIKPCIEFISAIPSVVLGFFGIAVLGQALRAMSQVSWLSWVPGFPYSERLNILTAGCLLALIAVPTIFTLAEDALNNVPRAFKEASFALGASRLQTILRIIVPASLSGIISAVLLGLGRVVGETMVVLLCAGNRIAIPDFTQGLSFITEPVHTMTGIIAQEMGEVVRGSIHYRALFVVGLVLFLLSLLINYLAQKIVRRYRISIG
ncbi:MAG: phosphate ABC transporter permease subunit PstC, partial [Opitutaceae bacterium]